MVRVVVLFNLKEGVSRDEYEEWARDRDVPTVTGLDSVENFQLFRTSGLLGSEAPAPHQYVEMIEVRDMETFQQEIGSAAMSEIAAQFQGYADSITFMLAERSA